jgi:hypothetical protein
MPYQVDRFNGTFLVSVADGTVDSTTDLRFLGKNYAGYGEVQNENFLHLLENFANTTPPPKAIGGQIWYDSATKRLKYYDQDNNKWRTTGGIEASPTAPVRLNVGDLWYDTSADQLYSWNGNAFVLIGPQPTIGGTLNPVNVDLIPGTDNLNYNIVSLKSGAGDTVAIFSVDNFIPNPPAGSENEYTGFSRIRRGINLFGTNDNGVTAGDFKFWGTASNADRLGGIIASEYIKRGDSNFDTTVEFPRIKIGAQPDRNIEIGTEGTGSNPGPYIESIRGETLTIRIRDSQVIHNLLRFSKPATGIFGAVFPGLSEAYNFGTPGNVWNNIYAQSFIGNVQGNLTGNTTGVHTGNLVANNNEVVFNADNRQFQGTFTGTFFGTLNGDITGSATQASSLNGIFGSTEAQPNTIAVRTSVTDSAGAGHIRATRFIGVADRAEQLRFGNSFINSSTASAPNTVVVRDNNNSINVNLVNGTATAANSLQADGGAYRTASSSAIGNTIVVRDAAGNIAVNGIVGAASQANQLLVDNSTFFLASTGAVANTIAVRDNSNILRAGSIQNTPIGTVDRAAGAFTTLTSNAATTFTANVASTNTTTGTLVVTGGVGITGALNVGSINVSGGGINGTAIGSTVRSSGAFTTLTSNAATTFTANVASTNTTTGTLVVTGGVGITGTLNCSNIVETSTIAVKENISPINAALDKIIQLSGVTYTRKDTGRFEAGLIAEDVQTILPDLVSTNTSGDAQGIYYTKLTAYLIEAIKSLKEEIEDLKRGK